MRTKLLNFKDEKGLSLISVALISMVIGIFMAIFIQIYSTWSIYEKSIKTNDDIKIIQAALRTHLGGHGRYPCPAKLNAGFDTAEFGREVACDGTFTDGTFLSKGRGNRLVRTGAVPVRTLDLPDDFIVDEYHKRYIYVVTEVYAQPNAPINEDKGAIDVIDGAGGSVTSIPGNLVEIVYSMKQDDNGAYSRNGILISRCDSGLRGGQNCDFGSFNVVKADATFYSDLNKSENKNNFFTHVFSYGDAQPIVSSCGGGVGAPDPVKPKDVGYIVDTSGSMASGAKCPEGLAGCSKRSHLARWALRHVIPARMEASTEDGSAASGRTGIGSFHMSASFGLGIFDPVAWDSWHDDKDSMVTLAPDSGSGDYINPVTGEVIVPVTNPVTGEIIPPAMYPATGFILPPEISSSGEITYSMTQAILGEEYQSFENTLQTMCSGGNTPLGDKIWAMAVELGDGLDVDHPNKIVALSDGAVTAGASLSSVGDRIASAYPNLRVDVVDVGNNPSLRVIAQKTGGHYFATSNPDEILDKLKSSVGLCSDDAAPDPLPNRSGCN